MIPAGVEVFVGLEPIDLRWGFDRLAGIVMERMGRDALSARGMTGPARSSAPARRAREGSVRGHHADTTRTPRGVVPTTRGV